ncbi:hypothetical protein OHS81_37210 [Streptomyces sp. NBC_00400]|uniref:hypothetical protein n=1 Tax=Streptomyces sp. NBC_00400 TaxID=2975737 RepID=UPI002E1EA6EB
MADVTDPNYADVTGPDKAQGVRVSRPRPRVGVVASFGFGRDREIWRWAPERVSLFIARTGPVTFSDTLELVSSLNRPGREDRPTREVCAIGSGGDAATASGLTTSDRRRPHTPATHPSTREAHP